MDFTQNTYKTLLDSLKKKQCKFATFHEFLNLNNLPFNRSVIILRHDVDRIPQNSLEFAKFENSLGIKGTYYFRVVPESYDFRIMNEIAGLGHELGYHYEDVDLEYCKIKRLKDYKINEEDLIDRAYESFCKNLKIFRESFDIKTICMHGSPLSPYDNKIIWKKYDYKKLGIIGEPYFDIDWNKFGYLTDTGRRWNGNSVSVRDKVENKYNFNFRTTDDIIKNINQLPDKMMFTIHPERWHDNPLQWAKELVFQNSKNILKKVLINKSK